MAFFKSDNIKGGRIRLGGATFDVTEIRYGANKSLIWPLDYTYIFSNVSVAYSSGTCIAADASNYAMLTAYVITKRGDTIIEQGTKTLAITAISDTTHFEIVDGRVYGKHLDDSNKGMGYQPFPDGLSFNITAAAYGTGQWTGVVAASQQANTSTQTGTTEITTAYAFTLSDSLLNSSGGTVTLSGTQTYTSTPNLVWTSGATSNGAPTVGLTRPQAPEALVVNPTPKSIRENNTKIEFAGNTGSAAVTYTIAASFDGCAAAGKTVSVAAPVYTYGSMNILFYMYLDVPASGGTVRPSIGFSVKYYIDGVEKGTMTGTFSGGATQALATCTETGYTAPVSCAYQQKSGNTYYQDAAGGAVSANSLGTTERTYRTSLGIRRVIVYAGSASAYSGDVVVYQAANYKYTTYTTVYTGFMLNTSPATLGSSDTRFTVSGSLYYTQTPHYTYSSGSTQDGPPASGSTVVSPTITGVTPGAGVSWSGTTVTIPPNTSGTQIEYTVSGRHTDPAGKMWTDSASLVQTPLTYTYGVPAVSINYDEIGDGYHIPASGNMGRPVYPAISFSQLRTPSSGTADYVTGSVSSGATTGTASDGSTFSVQYFGTPGTGGNVLSGGGVTIGTKGTTVSGITNAATGLHVRITIHAKTGQSNSVVVKQQANTIIGTEDVNVTYGIIGMAVTWATGGAFARSAGESGVLSYSSCKKYYYVKSYYTSGADATATTQSSTDITPTYSADSSKPWVPSVSGITVTAARRGKNDTDLRSGSIRAYYGTTLLGSLGILQAGTVRSFALTSNRAGGISFTAAGGEVTPVFIGIVSYDNGDSPDSTSGVPVTFLSGSDVANRISRSGTKITGANLGTTPYGATDTSYTWYWSAHIDAVHTIAVTQGRNEAAYGAISLTASSTNVPASGSDITFAASCTVTWTSGAASSLGADDFNFSLVSKGNSGKRTYTLSGNSLSIGSLGTNGASYAKTTVVRASHGGAGTKDVNITEAKNIVESTALNVTWDINGDPINGAGGSARIGIDRASFVSTYSSGSANSSDVDSEILLQGLSASGAGFSYSYIPGMEYGTLTATQNPSTTDFRNCTLTVSYGGKSASTVVSQYAYIVVITTQVYTLQGWTGQPVFGIDQNTLDRYCLVCSGAILRVYFASIGNGATNKEYRIRVDALGNGVEQVGSGMLYDASVNTVPPSAGTQNNIMESVFSYSLSEVERYSYIKFRFSLEGAPGQNLIMSGNYLDINFNV